MNYKNFDFTDGIKKSSKVYFPNLTIINIIDKKEWIRRLFEVEYSDHSFVFYKLITHEDWSDNIHEYNVVEMFRENGIPAPKVLVVDDSSKYIPCPYLIQEKIGGMKLGELINNFCENDILAMYKSIGKVYNKIHAVQNKTSGLWSDDPYQVRYPISPNDYMFNAEIVEGSGKRAVELGLITKELHEKIIELWKNNLDYLKKHTPSMIHNSPFLWNIYLDKINEHWTVTKLMSLGDVLWWDSAYDLATIKYPPFGEYNPARWNSFLSGYGHQVEQKRMLLYAIMHKLCACSGVYMEPKSYHNENYINTCQSDIISFINEINQIDIS